MIVATVSWPTCRLPTNGADLENRLRSLPNGLGSIPRIAAGIKEHLLAGLEARFDATPGLAAFFLEKVLCVPKTVLDATPGLAALPPQKACAVHYGRVKLFATLSVRLPGLCQIILRPVP